MDYNLTSTVPVLLYFYIIVFIVVLILLNFDYLKSKSSLIFRAIYRRKKHRIQSVVDLREIIKKYVYSRDLGEIDLDKKCVINTLNPHSFCISKKDPVFQKALTNSTVLLPDGFGIVLASKILFRKKINKIAGYDLHNYLIKHADLNRKSIFYLGASDETLLLITKKLNKEYPNISVASYSPPFKDEFSKEDSLKMIDSINKFSPDILFVGMTAPKQEKWVEANKNELSSTVVASIGAVFDFYAGTVNRSNPFWISMGLEWLPRLAKEPKRLWKRNFVSTPLFLLLLAKSKFYNNRNIYD